MQADDFFLDFLSGDYQFPEACRHISTGSNSARSTVLFSPLDSSFISEFFGSFDGESNPETVEEHAQSLIPLDYSNPDGYVPKLAAITQDVTSCYSEKSPEVVNYGASSSNKDDKNRQKQKAIVSVKKTDWFRCCVCGDRATGYHFNVLSCNGCKIFYRRTIVAGRKFVCRNGGRCLLNKERRCACRACRFQRCVEVGMTSEAIEVSEQPAATGEGARKRKSDTERFEATGRGEAHFQDRFVHPAISTMATDKDIGLLKNLMHVENCYNYLRTSNYPIRYEDNLNDLLQRPCALGELSKYQTVLFTENSHSLNDRATMLRWLGIDLYLSVEYAKSLDAFKQLNLSDQRALIRQTNSIIIFLTLAFTSYQMKSDTLTFPDGYMPAKHACVISGRAGDVRGRIIKMIVPPVKRCQMKPEHFVMLKAIIFYGVALTGLSDEGKRLVTEERERLCRALHNYLLQDMGPVKGPTMLGQILSLSQVYLSMSETRRNMLILFEMFGYVRINGIIRQVLMKEG